MGAGGTGIWKSVAEVDVCIFRLGDCNKRQVVAFEELSHAQHLVALGCHSRRP